MQIEDGTGEGYKAKVDEENNIKVFATDVSAEHHANHEHGTAFHMVFTVSGVLPGAAFVYIKNTDDNDMIVEGFRLYTQCNAVVNIVKDPVVATTVLGTTNVPSNVNLGAGVTATGTFKTAYSGAVSGITGGTTIDRRFCCSGCTGNYINFEMDVIIPKNKEMAFLTECCSGCNIAGTIPFYIHSHG